MPVTLVRYTALTSQYKRTSDRPRRRKSEPTEQWRNNHSWSEEHYSTDDLEGYLIEMFFNPVQHFLEKLSDRVGRLALYDTRCTTEYGTARVDRSLTVPTGA